MNESDIKQNTGKTNDEIDLFEFCSRMWKSFKIFITDTKDVVITIIIFLLRKSLWIILFSFLGMALGFTYYSFKKPHYTSLLEGTSGGVDNSVVIDHINRLNQMSGKPEILARTLDISIEQAQKIRYIKAFYGIDINRDEKPDYMDEFETYNPRDTMQIRLPSVFYVKAALYDEDVLPELREGLFKYINGNVYIQTLYEIDKRQKQEMIDELTKEIAKIDTLHLLNIKNKSSVEVGQKVFVMGSEQEIKLFYRDIISLYIEKQELQKTLEISDKPVVIVQDFIPSMYEEKVAMDYIVSIGFAMAFMGLVCAILWQYRKTLWKIIMEPDTQ